MKWMNSGVLSFVRGLIVQFERNEDVVFHCNLQSNSPFELLISTRTKMYY
jgi:hypothetical protein